MVDAVHRLTRCYQFKPIKAAIPIAMAGYCRFSADHLGGNRGASCCMRCSEGLGYVEHVIIAC